MGAVRWEALDTDRVPPQWRPCVVAEWKPIFNRLGQLNSDGAYIYWLPLPKSPSGGSAGGWMPERCIRVALA